MSHPLSTAVRGGISILSARKLSQVSQLKLETAGQLMSWMRYVAGRRLDSSHCELIEKASIFDEAAWVVANQQVRENPDKFRSGQRNLLAGKLVVVGEDGEVEEASVDDAKKVRIVCGTGLGNGSDKKSLRQVYESMRKLFPDIESEKYGVFSHPCEGEDITTRYLRGTMGYVNPTAVDSEASRVFFEQVIRTNFFDKDRLLPPEACPRIIMASHSIASREASFYLKFFKQFLVERGIPDVSNYMNKFLRVNIGSPSLSGLRSTAPVLNFVGLEDMAIRSPVRFFRDIYLNPDLHGERGEERVDAMIPYADGFHKVLITMGRGTVANGMVLQDRFASNPLGHGLEHYVVSILRNRRTSEVVRHCAEFLDESMSVKEFQHQMACILSDAKIYPTQARIPKEDNVVALAGTWHDYIERERNAKKSAMARGTPVEIIGSQPFSIKIEEDIFERRKREMTEETLKDLTKHQRKDKKIGGVSGGGASR